jgi:hypothetical protein
MLPAKGYTKPAAGLVTFGGTLNNAPTGSPITMNVLKGSPSNVGYNLVGNPFASAIVASTFLTDNLSVIDGTIWLWDQSSGTNFVSADFATINSLGATSGGGTQTPTGNVASGQGFFVHRSLPGSGNIQFRNSHRSATGNSQFFNAGEITRVWMNVTSPAGQYNEFLIGFKDDATEGVDPLYDSKKYSANAAISFYSVLGDEALSIQGLPFNPQGRTVQLGLKTAETGVHRISLKATEFLHDGELIFLEDTYLHTFQCMNETAEYQFIPTPEPMVNRFVLHFQPGLLTQINHGSCDGTAGSIAVTGAGPFEFTYELRNDQDVVVQLGNSEAGSMFCENLTAGIYQLSIRLENGFSYVKGISIEGEQALASEIVIPAETVTLDQAIVEFAASGEPDWSYNWNFGDGSAEVNGQQVIHPFMQAGIFTIRLSVSNGTCSIESFKTITVTQPETATGIESVAETGIFAFPNPAQDQLTVLLKKPAGSMNIFLYDRFGRLVFMETKSNSGTSLQLSTKEFASGVYLLKIVGDDQSYSLPLSIIH